MEEGISRKSVKVSVVFDIHSTHIYDYTLNTFGYFQAERYQDKIDKALETLYEFYLAYPECRHIPTLSRMYRNIILDAHLIIFRITDERIEVLDIIHSATSIRKIRGFRYIRL